MPGAAGPKARARRPIALCLPRSGSSIWSIAAAMARRGFMQPCAPGAHGKPGPRRAPHASSRHKGNNGTAVPAMHHRQPPRSSDRPQPAGSKLRRPAAQLGLARRHNLCANLRRLALSGCRARSFHKEDRWLGNARSYAGETDDRGMDHGHPAPKAAAWPNPPFRSRQSICCR